ncbi:MAG: DUF4976 domain-containing protein [Planctomycetota bacterium]|nr:MAG: DUF4976 domain-containing protein [Planctomycetota bacterium]
MAACTLFSVVVCCGGAPSRADDAERGRERATAPPPNFVLVFVDDLGWRDVGCYGNDFVETPHIDQLAADGIRFTDFYASGPVCSPTRCALQSGQNQARIGISDFIPGHWRPFERVITPRPRAALPLHIVTVAEMLQTAGYATGYIGKWHLGAARRFQPDRQGYLFSAVISGPHLPGLYRVLHRSDLKPRPGQYRTDFEAELAERFIAEHKDRPFFLMVSPFAVHIPLGAMSAKVEKYRRKAARTDRFVCHPVYAAMIEHVDELVGRIVRALQRHALTRQTMVVFTSDNGGLRRRYDYNPQADDVVTDLSPLRGEKGTLYEGGIRVPLIVTFPDHVPAGAVSHEPAVTHDLYPTFADYAAARLPVNQPIDGVSLRPVLTNPQARLSRDALFWHYPHYHHDRPASCVRTRQWKLIEFLDGSGDLELYRITEDIGEQNNLADQYPQVVRQLRGRLQDWRERVVAEMPLPNPAFDPDRAAQWWSPRTGRPIDSSRRKRFPHTERELDTPRGGAQRRERPKRR